MNWDNFRAELAEVMAKVEADYRALEVRQAPAVPYLLEATRNLNRAQLGLRRFAGGGIPDPDDDAS